MKSGHRVILVFQHLKLNNIQHLADSDNSKSILPIFYPITLVGLRNTTDEFAKILERTSGLEPSSETTVPRYLKLVTVSSICLFTFIFLWMPLALFVISLVFSALISIYIFCRFCREFLLGLLAPVLPQLEHIYHLQTADW